MFWFYSYQRSIQNSNVRFVLTPNQPGQKIIFYRIGDINSTETQPLPQHLVRRWLFQHLTLASNP